ncbi:MAG: prephenate dehydrogenase/arogenate dehydrogenase family protein [Chitinivibrionales bacterium]|nr:prephenate dehydrogenase/arogenate dehydrogenase family protein [Chitinivibrionales bacterium]MBD3357192.1 prephenate dehydrogenase/arogenate dehydrogenase family protein [Chitinivibrionales bacterium]
MSQNISYTPRKIIIYSVGLLGGSLGLAVRKAGYGGKIIGLSSPDGIAKAQEVGCIDEGMGYDQLSKVVAEGGLLFLCSPISGILQALDRLADLELPANLIITDIGSTKRRIVERARETLPSHVRFVGGHPMAGSEKRGPAAADPYLFQNSIYVLTPYAEQPDDREKALGNFLEHHLGCRHVFINPDMHDTIAATVSHVPHLLAVTLVNLAGEIEQHVPGTLKLAAGGFRDMTRIASAPYGMWRDILSSNRTTISPLLDRYMTALRRMRDEMVDPGLGEAFESAASIRGSIPANSKGFLRPLSEVLVIARDHPGAIVAIARPLAENGINIKDIEVLKVREGEGGTIRLAFESAQIAAQAVKILSSAGFTARERD